MATRIFIIDDEPDMVKIVTILLQKESYQVESETNPLVAIKRIEAAPPDLVLLDLQMPEMDGFEVCKRLHANLRTKSVPIIIVSVQNSEADVVAGLELGAKDYIQKPIRPRELLARVKSMLRRDEGETEPKELSAGPIRLDLQNYNITVDDKPITLRPKEFQLLALFIRRQGQVLTRPTISEIVWGAEHLPTSRTINTHVLRLRRKLKPFQDCIQSLKGIGYRFEMDVEY